MTAARILVWLIVAAGSVLVTAVAVPVIVGLRRGRPFGDTPHDQPYEKE